MGPLPRGLTGWTSTSTVGVCDRRLAMSLVLGAPRTGPGRVTQPHLPAIADPSHRPRENPDPDSGDQAPLSHENPTGMPRDAPPSARMCGRAAGSRGWRNPHPRNTSSFSWETPGRLPEGHLIRGHARGRRWGGGSETATGAPQGGHRSRQGNAGPVSEGPGRSAGEDGAHGPLAPTAWAALGGRGLPEPDRASFRASGSPARFPRSARPRGSGPSAV